MDGNESHSEDFVHLDATEWSAELDELARTSKRDLGIFSDVKTFAGREEEYPTDEVSSRRVPISRNSLCFCGSGKRYKRCHGAGMFGKKQGRVFRKIKS